MESDIVIKQKKASDIFEEKEDIIPDGFDNWTEEQLDAYINKYDRGE
jgi:hypothetical protein